MALIICNSNFTEGPSDFRQKTCHILSALSENPSELR